MSPTPRTPIRLANTKFISYLQSAAASCDILKKFKSVSLCLILFIENMGPPNYRVPWLRLAAFFLVGAGNPVPKPAVLDQNIENMSKNVQRPERGADPGGGLWRMVYCDVPGL